MRKDDQGGSATTGDDPSGEGSQEVDLRKSGSQPSGKGPPARDFIPESKIRLLPDYSISGPSGVAGFAICLISSL